MLKLNILGFKAFIHSNDETVLSRLRMDFEFFLDEKVSIADLEIKVELLAELPAQFIPQNLRPLFQRQNSITYELDGIRYNDYYGSVYTKFISQSGMAHIVGIELEKLYEVTYLLLLSRSGKFLDLKGIHKIHAFSVAKNNRGVICMQPMRGGKSTLLTHLLINADVEIFSDDTPLIDHNGNLRSFPLRVSLDKIPEGLSVSPLDHYLMKREFYKDKFSISLRAFKKPIAEKTADYFFIEAHRSSYQKPRIEEMSRLRLLKRLMHHMVIGFGLPLIFEYFWETGTADFWRKTKIVMSRFRVALKCALTKKGYDLYLCPNSDENAKAVLELLER